jgi:7-carboxy-7-deazaguanine synthase
MLHRLRISEIFYSLQGETTTVGLPTTFIRLTGCPLRCQYCDTAYAFHGGQWMDLEAIIRHISQYQASYVTVTGGEPLAQKACIPLLQTLCDLNYQVSLETSGTQDVAKVDSRVIKVMDLKTPGSGEEIKNRYQNLNFLLPHDQIKFVICDRNDYEWSKNKIIEFDLEKRCHVLFSPSYQQLVPADLADWIIKDQLRHVRMQIQLHKFLWGDVPGR